MKDQRVKLNPFRVEDQAEELMKGYEQPSDLTGPGGIMEELHKRLYERVLGAELTHYLGYGKGEAPEQAEGQRRENYRNGSSKKTLLSEDGKLEIDIARDRTGEFENPPITWKLAATQFAIRFGHRFLLHSRQARQRAPGGHVHGFCLFLPFPRHLHHQSRPPRRHALSRPGPDSLRLLPVAHLAHRSLGRGPADDSHHFFSLAQWSLFRAPASGPIHFPNLALRLGQRRNRLRHARGLSMRQPAGNIIQEAPLPVWANLRQRALDAAIAEINKKTDLNIALESLERSRCRWVTTLIFAIKAQAVPNGDSKGKSADLKWSEF